MITDNKVTMRISVSQKAVVQSLLHTLKLRGANSIESLSNVIDSINDGNFRRQCEMACKDTKLEAITVLAEVLDASDSLKTLFAKDSSGKDRDVKVSRTTYQYIHDVSQKFMGKWIIYDNLESKQVVKRFEFIDSDVDRGNQTIGTALAQLEFSSFNIQQVEEICLARGTHLTDGDWVDIQFYLLLLNTPTSGIAVRYELLINFTKNEAQASIKQCDIQQDRERMKDIDERSEDLDYDEPEIDDYDDLEL